jgi:hypothetical protein
MQTSCAWFFDDIAGIEAILVMRLAARAIELGEALGGRLEQGFLERLEKARSNVPAEGSGADVYRAHVRPARATAPRVAATGAMLALLGHSPWVAGYDLHLPADLAADGRPRDVTIVENATGSAARVELAAASDAGGPPRCRADGAAFTLKDLFPIQREELLDAVGRQAAEGARTARRAALAEVRDVLDPLLAGDEVLPPALALLLGYEEAESIGAAVAERPPRLASLIERAGALRSRGVVLPPRWLAGQIAPALEERLGALPQSAPDVLALLDLAEAAGVVLDLERAQARALGWCKSAPVSTLGDERVAAVLERLSLDPEPR